MVQYLTANAPRQLTEIRHTNVVDFTQLFNHEEIMIGNPNSSFVARIGRRFFNWRLNREIFYRVIPHAKRESDEGYPFDDVSDMVAQTESLIWLNKSQAGGKILFRFFHGSASDFAQWTVGLAETAINDG